MAVGVHNVEQADNVGIPHLLEEGDLADGGAGDSFILSLEADLLEGDDATIVGEVSGLVDDTVGAWVGLAFDLGR